MDHSALDKKYFEDPHKYNCPYCKRNHVTYKINGTGIFDWTDTKKCYVYFIACQSCENVSLHFSFTDIRDIDKYGSRQNEFKKVDIDNHLFFSQPSSSFTLDNRIPSGIRDLIFEAENSRQANLLVGASACLRKAIYELLEREAVTVRDPKTDRANYQESIKALKAKFSSISPELFDALGDIQGLASDHVHEGSWKAWDSPKLKILIELTKTTLHEMYVVPEERKQRLGVLSELKSVFTMAKEEKVSENKAAVTDSQSNKL